MKQIGPDGRFVLSPSPSPKDTPNHVGGGVVQLARTQQVGKVLDYGTLVGANKNVQGIELGWASIRIWESCSWNTRDSCGHQ